MGLDPQFPVNVPQAILVVGGNVLATGRVFPVLYRGDGDAGQYRQGFWERLWRRRRCPPNPPPNSRWLP